MNAQEIINYFTHAHKALWGKEPTQDHPYADASDAPFKGYCPEQISEVCYSTEVNKIVRDFNKSLTEGLEPHHICSPIKVIRKDFEGIVVKVTPEDDGSGWCVWAYDVFQHRGAVLRSSSIKIRPYRPGERDAFRNILELQEQREAMFSSYFNTNTLKVKLKVGNDAVETGEVGVVLTMPNKESLIWEVRVEWQSGLRTSVAVSNLLKA
jgi:hypothetical protein